MPIGHGLRRNSVCVDLGPPRRAIGAQSIHGSASCRLMRVPIVRGQFIVRRSQTTSNELVR